MAPFLEIYCPPGLVSRNLLVEKYGNIPPPRPGRFVMLPRIFLPADQPVKKVRQHDLPSLEEGWGCVYWVVVGVGKTLAARNGDSWLARVDLQLCHTRNK